MVQYNKPAWPSMVCKGLIFLIVTMNIISWPLEASHKNNQFSSLIKNKLRETKEMMLYKLGSGRFNIFAHTFNKTYSPQEIPHRVALFLKRRQEIQDSQRLYEQGKSTFAMGENEFLDWDEAELDKLDGHLTMPREKQLRLMEEMEQNNRLNDNERQSSAMKDPIELVERSRLFLRSHAKEEQLDVGGSEESGDKLHDALPDSVDWRTTGCVAEPISQKECGACYALTVMSVLETMHCIKNGGHLVRLSTQQVVDCSRGQIFTKNGYQNDGCNNGWPTPALQYLQKAKKVATEECYPFVYEAGQCRIDEMVAKANCTVPSSFLGAQNKMKYKVIRSEAEMLQYVARGPVVTLVDVTDKFRYFGRGIFDDPDCTNKKSERSHAITVVGYGQERGMDYWIVKNTWGTKWGQKGYAKYRRGKNACSIGFFGWAIIG